MKYKTTLITIATFLIIPLVSAYYDWGFNTPFEGSPLDYLDNEWVRFTAIFLVLFALIYFSINEAFKGKNKGVAAIISAGLTLLITIAIAQRGWLYSYAGDELGSWISIIAILIGLGFLIKVAGENFGKAGIITSTIVVWLLINYIDPYEIFSYGVNERLIQLYEFFSTFLGLIILIVIALIISTVSKSKPNTTKEFLKHIFDN